MIHVLVWICIYLGAGVCGVALARLVMPVADGSDDAWVLPIALLASVGCVLAWRGAGFAQLAIVALVGVPLIGSWYADVKKNTIPDVFTLLPLAVILGFVLLHRNWFVALAAIVTGGAFAAAALMSRGRGMGWGDVKLAAVSGAILGLPWSIGVLGTACFLASGVSVIRNRGTKPITFAPYIAAGVLVYVAVVPI